MVNIQQITQTVMGLSAAAVFTGAVFMLCPSGSMSKSVRYIFTLLFLCVCISLFLRLGAADFSVEWSAKTNGNVTEAKLTEVQAEQICSAALEDNTISFSKIFIVTDIDENGGIFISNVKVISDADAMLIKKVINQTVLTKEVTISG